MDKNESKLLSRRNFLKGIPVGIAGVVALNAITGKSVGRNASKYPKFPEGSIFKPADNRTDI